jgi:hypothetical protein
MKQKSYKLGRVKMDFGSNNKDKNRRKYDKLSAITSKAN